MKDGPTCSNQRSNTKCNVKYFESINFTNDFLLRVAENLDICKRKMTFRWPDFHSNTCHKHQKMSEKLSLRNIICAKN